MMNFINIILRVLCMSVLFCSCSDKLPRDKSCDEALFQAAGDRVFHDVWTEACNELHSMMILKDGKVVYERWATGHTQDELHVMWSVSKTFTATAIGFAWQDGLLNLDDKAVDLIGREHVPENADDRIYDVTVHDLLTMSSGIGIDCIGRCRGQDEFDWLEAVLAAPFVFEPGTRFGYNSMNSYLLSVIVTKVTGFTLEDYLNDKLFRKIGICEYIWDMSPQGYNAGGWGLYISTESLAKMGLFMLNRGEWNGKQILDSSWFDKAMSVQIMQSLGLDRTDAEQKMLLETNDWEQGYGYQMWQCRHDAVRLDGAWGQYCVILPQKNAVIAVTAHSGNGGRILNSIWDNVLDVL